jgi:hypothetical protein
VHDEIVDQSTPPAEQTVPIEVGEHRLDPAEVMVVLRCEIEDRSLGRADHDTGKNIAVITANNAHALGPFEISLDHCECAMAKLIQAFSVTRAGVNRLAYRAQQFTVGARNLQYGTKTET